MEKNVALSNLINLTNINIGFTPRTPTDFNILNLLIKKKTDSEISVSSLKRIWGYVNYNCFPSPNTLNLLSRFNGYCDWNTFLRDHHIITENDVSEYLSNSLVYADTLKEGDTLIIEWYKEKVCTIVYLGEHRFEVTEARNIKLEKGDRFTLH
ncbi:MAG: hypothetical protein K2G40_04395, partial [Muribaculaceae bacterium]|nr:hypothetical protein [Muribaculaceae bacterium]